MKKQIPLIISDETIIAIQDVINQAIIEATNDSDYRNKKQKLYMNKKEACEYVGVSFNTLKKFIDEGLRVVEVAGIEMIRKVDIDDFFENHTA
ncbi:helix-turn-helix domain-containing protein [Jeotgalicoccus huakuii]|nr:helix-turn-helix domain-containing protein [Jeotgalicoccus huakuii]